MTTSELEALVASIPFAALCGSEVVEASPEEVTGRLTWREDLCTIGGLIHGGALMTLADTIGAVCAFLNLPAGASTATLQSATNLLRAARGGQVSAVARPVHIGRSTIVVRTDLSDAEGRLLATTTQIQAVLAR